MAALGPRVSAVRGGARRSRRRGRGRLIVGVALVAFVLVASAVVWRRSLAVGQARELDVLVRRRTQLVSERAALQGKVRLAASRARIGVVAEGRLGMRVPDDTQLVFIPRTAAPAAPRR